MEREDLAIAIVENIQDAATHLAMLADKTEDIDAANSYVDWANWLRDWADKFFPPEEDWGGDNVIRFPIERRSA